MGDLVLFGLVAKLLGGFLAERMRDRGRQAATSDSEE